MKRSHNSSSSSNSSRRSSRRLSSASLQKKAMMNSYTSHELQMVTPRTLMLNIGKTVAGESPLLQTDVTLVRPAGPDSQEQGNRSTRQNASAHEDSFLHPVHRGTSAAVAQGVKGSLLQPTGRLQNVKRLRSHINDELAQVVSQHHDSNASENSVSDSSAALSDVFSRSNRSNVISKSARQKNIIGANQSPRQSFSDGRAPSGAADVVGDQSENIRSTANLLDEPSDKQQLEKSGSRGPKSSAVAMSIVDSREAGADELEEFGGDVEMERVVDVMVPSAGPLERSLDGSLSVGDGSRSLRARDGSRSLRARDGLESSRTRDGLQSLHSADEESDGSQSLKAGDRSRSFRERNESRSLVVGNESRLLRVRDEAQSSSAFQQSSLESKGSQSRRGSRSFKKSLSLVAGNTSRSSRSEDGVQSSQEGDGSRSLKAGGGSLSSVARNGSQSSHSEDRVQFLPVGNVSRSLRTADVLESSLVGDEGEQSLQEEDALQSLQEETGSRLVESGSRLQLSGARDGSLSLPTQPLPAEDRSQPLHTGDRSRSSGMQDRLRSSQPENAVQSTSSLNRSRRISRSSGTVDDNGATHSVAEHLVAHNESTAAPQNASARMNPLREDEQRLTEEKLPAAYSSISSRLSSAAGENLRPVTSKGRQSAISNASLSSKTGSRRSSIPPDIISVNNDSGRKDLAAESSGSESSSAAVTFPADLQRAAVSVAALPRTVVESHSSDEMENVDPTGTAAAVDHEMSEDDDDVDDFQDNSSGQLRTPVLPPHSATPSSIFNLHHGRKQPDETLSMAGPSSRGGATTRGRGRGSAARPRRAATAARIPRSLTAAAVKFFAGGMKVSPEALDVVEDTGDKFWANLVTDVQKFADRAGHSTVTRSDMEQLMKRQGLITDNQSLNQLIEKYLPLEVRQELIPVARSGNVLELKQFR